MKIKQNINMKLVILILSFFANLPLTFANSQKPFIPQMITFADVDRMEMNFQQELYRELAHVPTSKKKAPSAQRFYNGGEFQQDQESSVELSRVNLYVAAFTAIDLKIFEFKIQPYVELRFDKP
jgi:hypothetical protein